MSDKVEHSLKILTEYCKGEDYKGYDPFDGLNSTLFQALPFLSGRRMARLAWIQLFKRSPFNLRPLVGIKKEYNPKALGLFLSGYCNHYKITQSREYLDLMFFFVERIQESVNKNYSGNCWGYNFDWQARAFFQPKNTPTVVATTYISSALLDAYEITGNERLLESARSACDFLMNDLNRTYDSNGNFAFSYSPLDKSVVFNASLLGSRLLARVYSLTHESKLADAASESIIFCCNHQQSDGSWFYGTNDFHKWVDNFHTGFNLECIADFIKYTGNNDLDPVLTRGFKYYIEAFFTDTGIPKYYNNSVYPIDIHSPAQLIITLSKLSKFQEYRIVADKVLNWTIDNLQSKTGYFYYQINKYFPSRIPYMRWAQAWMFYALSEYLLLEKEIVQIETKL